MAHFAKLNKQINEDGTYTVIQVLTGNDNSDEDGFFGGFRMAKWWSSTEEDTKEAWSFSVGNDELDKGNLSKEEKGFGFSIRCIKR